MFSLATGRQFRLAQTEGVREKRKRRRRRREQPALLSYIGNRKKDEVEEGEVSEMEERQQTLIKL